MNVFLGAGMVAVLHRLDLRHPKPVKFGLTSDLADFYDVLAHCKHVTSAGDVFNQQLADYLIT